MKYILKAMLMPALALPMMLASCETDNDSNPTLDVSQATSFVLNVPGNAANNTYDLVNGERLNLTCSQPNYGGVPYVTDYHVQVSLKSDFSAYKELATSYQTATLPVDASEVNAAMIELFQEENPDTDYPNSPCPLYVRLRAHLYAMETGECMSNVITLPSVLATYRAPQAELPTELFVVGSDIQNAWSSWKATAPVYGIAGQFFTMIYASANSQFKWGLFNNDWRGYDRIKTYDDQANAGVHEAANDGNIQIDNPGWYTLLFESEIVGSSVQFTLHIYPAAAYIIGATTDGDWTDANSISQMTAPADQSGLWESPAFTGSGELRAYIKIPGHSWWTTEFTLHNGNLYWRTVDIPNNWAENVGAEYSVSCGAGQKLYVDFNNMTGEVK
ncbi:MAG: SusF/SusE family outer membrane protein [Prevotella sp.]|nr:SusF/SusE family outer membrane protein [Prevotella sp.]MBR1463950.1 SusF/SusE family outer membrane protein [Prevotella sp.]